MQFSTNAGRATMVLDKDGNLNVHGKLNTGSQITLPNSWSINTNDGHFRLYKGDKLMFAVHDTGQPWVRGAGFLVGMGKEYELRSAQGQCLDSGSNGQGCDWNNNHKKFRLRNVGGDDGEWNNVG